MTDTTTAGSGNPKDDGKISRKFLTTVIGGGVILAIGTFAMVWSLVHWGGDTPSSYVSFDQWKQLCLYLFATAVLGYGIMNNGEKWILTRNGKPPKA